MIHPLSSSGGRNDAYVPDNRHEEVNERVIRERPGQSSPAPSHAFALRKASREALTGENAGQPLSCEIHTSREPTLLSEAEGNTPIAIRASR